MSKYKLFESLSYIDDKILIKSEKKEQINYIKNNRRSACHCIFI